MILEVTQHAWGTAFDVLAAAPNPGGGTAPPGSDKIVTILQWAKWIFTAVAVGGALITGGRMVIAHRRGDDTNVSSLGFLLAGCVLAGAAPHLVDALA
jgi:hypothetical protein